MNLGVNPGPLNEDVLFLSDTHRARALFTNTIPDNVQLNVRRGDQKFWEYIRDHHVPESVMTYIRVAGFGGVIDCGYRTVQHALITSLVERWRPETHTFHLPFGEVTITFQDVQVLWGLSVNGHVVSGIDYVCPIEENLAKCVELLGFTPQQNDTTGGRIKLSRILREIKSDFPENPTELETKSMHGNIVFGQRDIWSDVLATNVGMGKNYMRERITCMSPILYFDFDSTKPYGARVTRQFNILQKIPNALPIDKTGHKRLHALTRQGKANKGWRREHHHYMQAWDGRFFNEVNGEFNNVASVSIDYMQWFWERTVLHITNPGHHEANPHGYQNHGGRFQVMVDGVTQIYQMTGNLIGTYPENARKLEPLRDMAIGFMRIVNQISRLNYSTTHLTRNNVEFGGDTGPQRARRRTRTRARRQGDETNNRGKEVVDDEEYHSQPTPKASKWIFQKWRRQPKEKSENASSSTLIQNTEQVCLKNPHEDKTEDVEEIPQQKRKWAIPNEDSNKWSQDVLEFYNNGDAPFCYSLYLKVHNANDDYAPNDRSDLGYDTGVLDCMLMQ
ncbi:hypothetical protein E3N88_41303 [Mikania micrantha]|uniref:Aminotransferase-like plant mobile domain-containing protein n=1 Tax=Mikania micrantha TaxID=192012 RepID=A0A5N6LQA2_9ASTR|nr:hypothetical protein E3N88_41303 [Mikania micrantha]